MIAWKIVNGQWSEFTKEDYSNATYHSWLDIKNDRIRINVGINEDEQKQRWKVEIRIEGNIENTRNTKINTIVYINQFPDLLSLLRDADMLERLTR